MRPRERAAAELAAWAGDAVGCIAHLQAEVERQHEAISILKGQVRTLLVRARMDEADKG